jgi:RimJ/RimL family protein N-acetyltransferase
VTRSAALPPSPTQTLQHSNALLAGSNVSLIPLAPSHTTSLWKTLGGLQNSDVFTFIPAGPYETEAEFAELITNLIETGQKSNDGQAYAIFLQSPTASTGADVETTGTAVGIIRLLNVRPEHLSVEIGYVIFSKQLQKTVEATTVFYLLIKHVVEDLGYERVEWKCNALNEGSKRAALRLGFVEEGLFRRHLVIKGVVSAQCLDFMDFPSFLGGT